MLALDSANCLKMPRVKTDSSAERLMAPPLDERQFILVFSSCVFSTIWTKPLYVGRL